MPTLRCLLTGSRTSTRLRDLVDGCEACGLHSTGGAPLIHSDHGRIDGVIRSSRSIYGSVVFAVGIVLFLFSFSSFVLGTIAHDVSTSNHVSIKYCILLTYLFHLIRPVKAGI